MPKTSYKQRLLAECRRRLAEEKLSAYDRSSIEGLVWTLENRGSGPLPMWVVDRGIALGVNP